MSIKTTRLLFYLFIFSLLVLPDRCFAQADQRVGDALDSSLLFKETLEYDKAINILEKITDIKKYPEASAMLGKLYYLKGDSNKALEVLKPIKKKNW